ncbi:MAG: NAD(P)/FAD-dependent oxidoreductase [Nitrospiraceae bacterium]
MQADITVVGAGAAGLAAGIFAAEAVAECGEKRSITLLDSARTLGAKILVSGGGRCNVTHERVTAADFNGTPHLVRNVLAAFPAEATCRWFAEMGVELKREETGKIFPITDKARTVLQTLLARCGELNIEIRPGHRVTEITSLSTVSQPGAQIDRSEPRFLVRHEQGTLQAKRVILATGGRSLPRTGSDGQGYEIARRLGHTVTSTHPALVPLMLDSTMFHTELSGVSQHVELSTTVNGKTLDRRSGSLLWTHNGISGPVVMDASRFWTIARGEGAIVEMRCSFFPEMDDNAVERWLVKQSVERPKVSVSSLLTSKIPERVARSLYRFSGIDPQTQASQLTRERRRSLIKTLTGLVLPIVADRGWNHAEVTAGGVPLDEINFRTMESRHVPGLYLIGEILDCDGRIGGFNFQWAWSTGYVAGQAVAAGLCSKVAERNKEGTMI